MKTLIVIFCFALQLGMTSAAQAWSLSDSYRGFPVFGVECQVVAATDEEGQKKEGNEKAAEEEVPDCE